ncbi:hypothetical protein ACH46F_23140 [Streptomyces virginiae]|uniref:hypothetical protein n=1 Tax=Streptomyces virginiae TaxID=1961 RepID=UPI00379F82CD
MFEVRRCSVQHVVLSSGSGGALGLAASLATDARLRESNVESKVRQRVVGTSRYGAPEPATEWGPVCPAARASYGVRTSRLSNTWKTATIYLAAIFIRSAR